MPGLLALSTWILYAVNALFHVDLLHLLSDPAREKFSPTEDLIFAAIVTLLLLAVAIVKTREAIALARCGVEVKGTISRHGIAFRHMVRVECSYTAGNAEQVFIWSTLRVAPR